MNGQEIRDKIDSNAIKMKTALHKFVLTNEIQKIIKENEELRAICPHEFINGICKYCDTKETKK